MINIHNQPLFLMSLDSQILSILEKEYIECGFYLNNFHIDPNDPLPIIFSEDIEQDNANGKIYIKKPKEKLYLDKILKILID